jgi:hypothetical protein
MTIMNTSKAWEVLEMRVISWPIPIWCGVKSKLVDKNSKLSIILFNTINKRLTSSTYSLIDFSLPLIGSLVTMATWIGIVKV